MARVMARLSVSNAVLLIICLMYLILYVDRVNISTAAPLIKAEFDLSNRRLNALQAGSAVAAPGHMSASHSLASLASASASGDTE